MSISNTIRMKRRPTHPGEMLCEDFLSDHDLTASSLAKALGVSRQSINELLHERRRVSPEMALQNRFDLQHVISHFSFIRWCAAARVVSL